MPRGRALVYPSPCGPSFSLSYLCGLPQSLPTWEGQLPEFFLIGYFLVLGWRENWPRSYLYVSSSLRFQPWFLDAFGCSLKVMPQSF